MDQSTIIAITITMAPPHSSSIPNYDSIQESSDDELLKQPKTQCSAATAEESEYDSDGNNNNGNNNNNANWISSVRTTTREGDGPTNEYVLNVAFLSFVGFMAVQACFAIIANSESMLADSEAMSVDALTYLFNMCAERIKNRPPTEAELRLPLAVREHQIEMRRLYLELIPPLISVVTLIAVTIGALREAFGTLFSEGGEDEDVSAGLMLFFSGLNLLLDAVNVTCFARANQAYGLQKTYSDENQPTHFQQHLEAAQLLMECSVGKDAELGNSLTNIKDSDLALTEHTTHDAYLESWFGNVNLNMCSAWTVSQHFGFCALSA